MVSRFLFLRATEKVLFSLLHDPLYNNTIIAPTFANWSTKFAIRESIVEECNTITNYTFLLISRLL